MVGSIDIPESREIRFRRTVLLKSDIHQQNGLEIKIADEFSEWIGSFMLLYKEYLRTGYVFEQQSSHILFNIHHLLPETAVFITKISNRPESTLTQFLDNSLFGLPSDLIYQDELDQLRDKGRVIAELGSLVTRKQFRWQNQFLYLCRTMYWYARIKNVNDWIISVNPKHVPYYKTIFLFEIFGQEKFHPGVRAPAVLMRLDLERIQENLMAAYGNMEEECNLHDFFHCSEGSPIADYEILLKKIGVISGDAPPQMDSATVRLLLNSNTGVLKDLCPIRTAYLHGLYPGCFFDFNLRNFEEGLMDSGPG